MRVDRLELVRYGHFDAYALDFGQAGDGPDLHVVYGDNEAGKSTTCHALLDLLFGIKSSNAPYTFRHARKLLRIEATLRDGERVRSLARTGRGLLDQHDAKLDELTLQAWLHGLDRDSFVAMFSMDEDTLEQGGDDILASKGELGSLLFSAGSGLADVDGRLEGLLADSAGYYLTGGRKQADWPLKQDLAELANVEATLKSIDVRADEWQRRRAELTRCATAIEEADARDVELRRAFGHTEQRLALRERALELIGEQREFDDRLPQPEIPADWSETLDSFVPATRKALDERHRLASELEWLDQALAAPPPDARLLEAGERIDTLANEALELARDATRLDADEPARDEAARAAARELARLGIDTELEGLDDPLLGSARREASREALMQHGEVETSARNALQEFDAAEREFRALGEAPIDELPSPDPLDDAVRSIDEDEDAATPNELRRHRDECLDKQADAFADLVPWRGDPTALERVNVPTRAALDALRTKREKVLAARDSARTNRDERRSEHDALLEPIAATRTSADDARWQDSQDGLQTLWRAHRDALASAAGREALASSADAFERGWHRHERLATERDAALEARLNARALELRRAAAASGLTAAEKALVETDATLVRTDAEIANIAERIGLPADRDVAALQDWIDHRETALLAARALVAAERRLKQREVHRAEHASRLRSLLEAAGAEPDADATAPLEQRLRQARDRSKALTAMRQARNEAARLRSLAEDKLAKRRAARDAAADALQRWLDDWQTSTDGSALAGLAAVDAKDRLDALDRLAAWRSTVLEHDGKRRRLEAASERHAREVTTLVERFEILPDTTDDAPLNALGHRLADARAAMKERASNVAKRETAATALTQLEQRESGRFEELQARYARLEVESLDALHSRIIACRDYHRERQRLARVSAALLADAATLDDGADVDGTAEDMKMEAAGDARTNLEVLAALDGIALESEAARLRDSLAALKAERDEHLLAHQAARDALAAIGTDDAVARLEERRATLLTRIEESAHDALAVRLGVAAAREGVRRWRAEHRSEMLSDASETFARITAGAFTSLAAEPDDTGTERVYACDVTGTVKLAKELSKGTRFQLYLALRVAAYRRWCRHRPPPPFIADDVLETFDDERTASTFEAFAEMAKHGQVIYLTHHRHVVDIAREVTHGTVSVHELPARPGRDVA